MFKKSNFAWASVSFLFFCVFTSQTGAKCPPPEVPDITGLIAHWRLDETDGATAYDSVGGHDGVVHNANWTDGKINGALNFDGDGDYVRTSYEGGPSEYTVALWYNLNEDIDTSIFDGYLSLVSKTGSHANHDLWNICFYKTGLVLANEKSVNNYASVNYKPAMFYKDQWHHVVATGTSTEGRIYFDGELKNTVSDDFVNGAWDDLVPFNIAKPYNNLPERFFNGKIDEVMIFDRVLSAAEIQELYGEPPRGPIAHWRLDETDGFIAHDSVGGNHGTVHDATWTDGKINGALNFDGDGDFVQTGYEGGPPEYSIALWYNSNEDFDPASSIPKALVSKTGTHHSHDLWSIWFFPPYGLLLQNEKSGSNYAMVTYKPDMFYKDEWHHVVVTATGFEGKIYFDGKLRNTTSDNFITSAWDDIVPFDIARPYNGDADRFFNGKIDEVMIFDRVLSDEQVWQLYYRPPVTIAFDIKPGSSENPLNVKSKGKLPAAILGAEDFDVYSIDVVSLRLEGVAPIRHSYEDVSAPVPDGNDVTTESPDGFMDLTLKFDTQEIVSTFGEVNHKDILTLTIQGVLMDDTPIEGSDSVKIVGRHKPLNQADINKDGVVDLADFVIFSNNWLKSSIIF
ncbi:LamG domain-containing protein [Planctomycetota bacterium]